jgi:hypothetical protein
MSGQENGRVVSVDLELLKPSIDAAINLARESASHGPTGFGAVVTTGDGKVIVVRAPLQLAELVEPVTLLNSYGDGYRADAIWRGHLASAELADLRKKAGGS